MTDHPFILADVGDHLGVIIFLIVVFVLWGYGALSSAVNRQKKQQAEQARRRDMFERMQREAQAREQRTAASRRPRGTPPLPPAAPGWAPAPPWAPPAPMPPPLPTRSTAPAVPTFPDQRKSKRAKPVVASAESVVGAQAAGRPAAVMRVVDAPVSATELTADRRPSPLSANAAAVSKWLTADTLRSQFVLTEILQPPVALREPRED